MERTVLTEDYLLEHGFVPDEEYNQMIDKLNDDHYFDNSKGFLNSDGRIKIIHGSTNRYGDDSYDVHVDNEDYESIGSLDVKYVDEFETFLKIIYNG